MICLICRYIEFVNDTTPKVLYIEFDSKRTGQITRQEHQLNASSKSNINENWVPIKEIAREVSISKNAYFQAFRKQFPLTPAEAVTIHKSQGSTCESVCVNLNKSTLTRDLLYVALSRVTKLSNLYIVGEFKATQPPKDDNETMIEINRLKTEKPLKVCYNTLEEKLGIVIAYHNVLSFGKHVASIRNDEWYQRCDVLVLSETRTLPSSEPTLSGFNLVHRCDVTRTIGTRGILVFAKPHIVMTLIDENLKQPEKATKYKYHSQILSFEMSGNNFITGYKSPNTPVGDFEEQMTTVLTSVRSKNSSSNIVMGDFNFDLTQKGNNLKSLMRNFNMESRLGENESTTTNNTQIDVVFTDFPNVIAGTYESYFSDHKPIYCMITDKTIAIDLIQNIQTQPDRAQSPPNFEIPDFSDDDYSLDFNYENDGAASPISILSGSPLPDDEIDRLIENAGLQMAQMIDEIWTERCELSNFTIDYFIEHIVRNQFAQYNMQLTQYTQFPNRYTVASNDRDDIQIIYADHHYVVSFCRVESDRVDIYDSLHMGNISPDQRNILERIYPGKRLHAMNTATRQPDAHSCGIFAIANVTSLLHGLHPCEYELSVEGTEEKPDITMSLRMHLVNIFVTGAITLFPTVA